MYDKNLCWSASLQSLHCKRAMYKICFSVFWRSEEKACVLKQLLLSLLKKLLFCEIECCLKSKNLNSIFLLVLMMSHASLTSWYSPSKDSSSTSSQEDHLAPPATWPRNNDYIQEYEQAVMLVPMNATNCTT